MLRQDVFPKADILFTQSKIEKDRELSDLMRVHNLF